jgi:hypothetical protein
MSTSDREVAQADYDAAYKIVEQMGFGFEFRHCSCGQLPCARLRPIVTALTTARKEQAERVWKDAIAIVQAQETLNKESYEYWKSIASEPDTNFGVLKFAAWGGEDSRIIAALEAAAIRAAENLSEIIKP